MNGLKIAARGGKSGGGKGGGKGGGQGNPNWPAKTGKPSGPERGNNPPKK